MVKTIIKDKQMLFLALFAAFFVGSAITGVFSDYEAEAKKDNDGNNGCEKSENAKSCESNPNTEPLVQTVKITAFKEDLYWYQNPIMLI